MRLCVHEYVRENNCVFVRSWQLEGVGMVAVGGDEKPLSFHSNTLTQSVSMATDNSIS